MTPNDPRGDGPDASYGPAMSDADRRTAHGALFTDMYQLTMAQLYYRQGLHDTPAQFDYFFRSYPDYGGHEAGYAVSAGLAWFLDWLQEARFGAHDIELLRGSRAHNGARLFEEDFLAWLSGLRPGAGVDILAVPEGRVVHAGAPLAVVRGPLASLQLLESSLLNHLNYPTLIATKAARVVQAARGGTVTDFGMRRGHERGVNAGSRAALVGGVHGSSNTGLSFTQGVPPRGTHAHAMVQAIMALGGSEADAFQAYADQYPDDCLLLVDTVDTLGSGVPNAIEVFERLRARGHEPVGIRLDSGDLAYLSIRAARLLDDAGFADATIVLSNQLDEITIWQILTQIDEEARSYGVDPRRLAARLAYGVGTNLVTSAGDAALDGVFKLVQVRAGDGWRAAIKISDNPAKVLTPGDKRVWRLYDARDLATADLITLADEDPREDGALSVRHPTDPGSARRLDRSRISRIEPLLEEVFVDGARTQAPPDLDTLRARCRDDLRRLDPGVRRLVNPHVYHVSLSESLAALRDATIRRARSG